MSGPHPTHKTRFSFDASTWDEICVKCGNTDIAGGGWGKLAEPCPQAASPYEPWAIPGTIGPMATKARERPAGYHRLTSLQQWEIDQRLGILDWNGSLNE